MAVSNCDLSSLAIPAGLPPAVDASLASAARPAFAVPTSGVPVSYNHKPPPQEDVENKIKHRTRKNKNRYKMIISSILSFLQIV